MRTVTTTPDEDRALASLIAAVDEYQEWQRGLSDNPDDDYDDPEDYYDDRDGYRGAVAEAAEVYVAVLRGEDGGAR